MPGNVRQANKRELDRAMNNIDWAISHLYGIIEQYKELHPEVSDPLIEAGTGLFLIKDVIEKVKDSI